MESCTCERRARCIASLNNENDNRGHAVSKQKLVIIILALFTLTFSGLSSTASNDWSQFRGPNASGVSNETGLPVNFGPDQNVVWKTLLPPGHSSPVLTNDRIFVTAHEANK